MLIALAIIAIAFGALALTQVSSLRASSRSRLLTDDKTAANQVLEQTMAKILQVTTSGNSNYDDNPSGSYRSFYFIDYYYSCPSPQTPQGVRQGDTANLRSVVCTGSQTVKTDTGDVKVDFGVDGEGGVLGEGDILVWAHAEHVNASGTAIGNDAITLTNRITCYDVYPSPSADAPEPCPAPPADGSAGGRTATAAQP